MNKIIISGVLGQIESRFTQDTQQPVASGLFVFTTEEKGNAVANTLKVTAWGQNLSPALVANSGQEVTLEGRLQMNKREDNGIKKTVAELVVSKIHGVSTPEATSAQPTVQPTGNRVGPAEKSEEPDYDDIPF